MILIIDFVRSRGGRREKKGWAKFENRHITCRGREKNFSIFRRWKGKKKNLENTKIIVQKRQSSEAEEENFFTTFARFKASFAWKSFRSEEDKEDPGRGRQENH
jgi:hypothetical protein